MSIAGTLSKSASKILLALILIGSGCLFAQQGDQAVAALKQAGQYESLRSAFLEAQHQVEPQEAGFRLQNPENRLRAEFQDGAITAEHPDGRLGLRLQAYGYGKRLQTPAPASVHAAGTRIEYRRGPLTEWYVNEARGLEQGFTLRERPDHPDGGPLKIELAVSGSLQPVLARDQIELRRNGRAILLYTGLRAWDSSGRALDGRMAVRAGRILLEVADREAVYPVTVDPWIQQQMLTASDGGTGDSFGQAVSVSGDTAVIGAPQNSFRGATYVFTRSGNTWTQQQKLTASDGAFGDLFGQAVSVSGDTAVIGAPQKNFNQGATYVFTRSGNTWTQQQKVTASDAANNDLFGISVSVNGDTAVIGASGKGSGEGVAYVFVRSGTTWTQQAELAASDAANNDAFGISVSIDLDTAVIGAAQKNLFQGATYVFTRSGSTWTQQQKLTASDAANNDAFGNSVSVSGDTAVIGAPQKNFNQGATYVFTRSGNTWTQQQKVTASDAANNDLFGISVSVDGDTAVIGTLLKSAAYTFVRSDNIWTQQQELVGGAGFGVSVSVNAHTAIVGAYHDLTPVGSAAFGPGAAYVFVQPPDLTITKTHTGTFAQSGAGSYVLTVTNAGTGPTVGTVTVVDTLPTGLTATAISGTGWTCTLGTLTCTRADALAAGASYPSITVTVNVAANAPASVTNTASVSGGGEANTANDTATDVTTITFVDLTITKTHTGNFAQGGAGSYVLTVTNAGTGPTVGTVTVVDTLTAGLTATAISGTGWTCTLATLTCTRTDVLAAGASYPTITVTVTIAGNAPTSLTNSATVSGGGELNATNNKATDVTTIAPGLVITAVNSTAGVSQGNTAVFIFNVAEAAGLSLGTITFSCSGLPPGAACIFTPPSVTALPTQVALAISTSNLHFSQNRIPGPLGGLNYLFSAMMLPFIGLVPMGRIKDRRNCQRVFWLLLIVFALVLLAGCGFHQQSGTHPFVAPGSYNITVTAASSTGNVQAQAVVTLTVQ